jgi:hypothetical protein
MAVLCLLARSARDEREFAHSQQMAVRTGLARNAKAMGDAQRLAADLKALEGTLLGEFVKSRSNRTCKNARSYSGLANLRLCTCDLS